MPLTDKGFQRPTFDDLLNAQIERAKEFFGEDIDTSETSVLGKFIRLNVTDIAEMYETLEGVYYARFPNTARGINLDRLCAFVGIKRNAASYAKYKVTYERMNLLDNVYVGATVPYGFEYSNEEKTVVYHTIDDYSVTGYTVEGGTEMGRLDMYIECNEIGSIGNLSPDEINTVINPIPLLAGNLGGNKSHLPYTVTLVSEGADIESDVSLRKRFLEAVSSAGSSTLEALKSAVLRVTGVEGVSVVENATNTTVDNMPPHSFQCYVLCTDDNQLSEIAKVIFDTKPIGIQAYGTKTYTVVDEAGTSHNVAFSETIRKEIYLQATLQTNSYFNSDELEVIKENIVAQINTSKNGDEVYISSFYGYLHTDGVESVTSLKLSTDGTTYTANNVICADNEVARSAVKNITIEVV